MQIILISAGVVATAGLLAWVMIRGRKSGGETRNSDTGASQGTPNRLTDRIPVVMRGAAGPSAFPDANGPLPMQGNLTQTRLHDFLQYLSLGGKSGILELASGRRTGRMIFQSGRICKSSFRGKEGVDAAFLMLDLPEGDFEFQEQALEGESARHPMEVVDVIMQWMDRKPRKTKSAG